jgi:hypothetical protein
VIPVEGCLFAHVGLGLVLAHGTPAVEVGRRGRESPLPTSPGFVYRSICIQTDGRGSQIVDHRSQIMGPLRSRRVEGFPVERRGACVREGGEEGLEGEEEGRKEGEEGDF